MSDSMGLPSASGARISGDDYQHMFTWFHAVQLLRDDSGIVRIEFEVGDAGNVDDLVVYRSDAPTLYHQIKYVVSQDHPLTHDWFTTPTRPGGTSPLHKFRQSHIKLSGEHGPAEMVLLTNRQLAAGDPILSHLGGRDDKLIPRLALQKAGSASGRARREWADHLGLSEGELLKMLEHLAIKAGRASIDELRELCTDRMAAAGLRGLPEDVTLALGLVREMIGTGCRSLERGALEEMVARVNFASTARRATLAIQAIDRTPAAEGATEALDWVDLFEGDAPTTRRRLVDGGEWNGRIALELNEAARALRAAGYPSVRLEGSYRLSVGFAAGEALPRTTGVKLSCRDYASDQAPADFPVTLVSTALELGSDIAIGISVSADVTADALRYVRRSGIPARRFVNIVPAGGPGLSSIPDPAAGMGFVFAAFERIREETAGTDGTVHLFLACPLPVAVMLGHVWNRIPDTQLYEDANGPDGYFPSFRLARR